MNKEKNFADPALELAEDSRDAPQLAASFASKLFMGEFDYQQLLPFPEENEEEKKFGDEYVAKIMALLEENLDPDEVDEKREIPFKVIKALATIKAFALKIPKKYGGLGISQTTYNRIIMSVGAYCGSTAVLLSAHQSIGVPQPLVLFGTEEQKKKYLPRFAEGAISAFALTEPEAGSDPAHLESEAVLSDDGSHYILNGEKLWCTNGAIAEIIVVMAKTAPKIVNGKEKKQISAFILEMSTPGVEIVHRCQFMGLGGIYNAYMRFTNVKIPKENLLGNEGRGLAMALSTINVGRLSLPAGCAGVAKKALAICKEWGNGRVQWGKAIGRHEWGKEKISFIAATTLAMEAVTWLTSRWSDGKKIDVRIEAAMAKLFCSESLWKIVDMTLQLRGGRGYEKASSLKARGEKAYPVERMMRDCRINTIIEGSSEIMKLFLAREAIDPHLKVAGGLMKKQASILEKFKSAARLTAFYGKWYGGLFFQGIKKGKYPQLGSLERHFQYAEGQCRKLARKIFYSIAKYQQKLEAKQRLLGRLMDIGTELFALCATCAYAVHLHEKNKQDKSPIDTANYFCLLAKERIELLYSQIDSNIDKESNALAESVLDSAF